jgi:quercetin dioxygenase-like cupin family protein
MVTNMRGTRRTTVRSAVAMVAAVVVLSGCGGGSADPAASGSASGSGAAAAGQEVLLDAQQLTILDQPIAYPKKGSAQVSSAILRLEPGQETGWHKHKVPLFAYVLEGTISVEYDAGVTKEYTAGTSLMEAQGVWHNGTNKGDVPVRILTVFMGASGVKNSVDRAP